MNETKRVCAYLQGGLGNQCFIYATARAAALRAGASLAFNTDLFLEDRIYRRRLALTPFSCDLSCLPTSGKFRRTLESLRSRTVRRFCSGIGNYRCDRKSGGCCPTPTDWKGTLVMDGYWQSERYFYDQREQILKDFALRDASALSQDELAKRIRDTEHSIFLHVRSYREAPESADGRCALRLRGYYRNAVRYLAERLPNGTVFVFSDEIEWTRQNVLTDDVLGRLPLDFVFNAPTSSPLRDFMLMRLCRHGVVADSSFSWWAGWLGEQERLAKGESVLRLRVNRRVMNDDFWPIRWVAIDDSL